MQNTTFHIETFGCQMNDRDSEIMAQLLSESFQPALQIDMADIVLVNTCSIREKAQQKAFSLMGRLKGIKKKRPEMIIGVLGCVAQQEGEKLLRRMPYIDLVIGTQNIYNLPALLADIKCNSKRIVAIDQSPSFVIPPYLPNVDKGPSHKRFVTIMQGCNNYCTYCVVPFTRGREISRDYNEILSECNHLVDNGVKEITLLGQNVNSYGSDFKSDQRHNFANLLKAVSGINGLQRLRFTTSNPKDLTDELIQCYSEIEILCSHFHLPVQSGSNAILKKMNRKYSIEEYINLVDKLRLNRSNIAISTDIIVGFPGESDDDFMATMDLIEKIRYHSAFSFKYSDRPQAKSVSFPGKLTEIEKGERLSLLQKRIDEIIYEINREYIGKVESIMVEGKSKNDGNQFNGRTSSNHIVHFPSDTNFLAGEIINVKITEACQHSLRGVINDND